MTNVRGLLGSCCLLLILSAAAHSQSATPLADNVSICAKAERCVKPVGVLNQGERVEVELSIGTGSREEWCLIRTVKEPSVTGYVPCLKLDQSDLRPPSPMKRVDPKPERHSTTVSDQDIENLQCDKLNYEAWISRLEFSEEQRNMAETIADRVGASQCTRNADDFKRRYMADMSKSNKAWLLQKWARIDPNESCVMASRQFWRQIRPYLTESQKARLRSDMTILQRTIIRIQMDPSRCIPIFCLY